MKVRLRHPAVINKTIARDRESGLDPVEPLYSVEDVLRVLERMIAVPTQSAGRPMTRLR